MVGGLALLILAQSGCLWSLWSRLRVNETCAQAGDAARAARDAAILRRLEAIYQAVDTGGK